MKALGRTLLAILLIAVVGAGVYFGIFRRDLFQPTHTITFVCDEVDLEETTVKVKDGKTVKLPTPEREGYTFDGWFNGDEKWTNTKLVTDDLILTAKWTKNDLIINFVNEDGNSSQAFSLGQALPTAEKKGYNFEGWTKEGNDQVYTTAQQEIVGATLRPKFTIIEYTITYNLDGGSAVSNPTTYTVETPTFTLSNPTKSDFEFGGWTESKDASPKTTYTVVQGSTGNLVFTAKWQPEKVNVSFVVDGKEIDFSKTIDNGKTLNDISLNAETLGLSGYTLSFYSNPAMTISQSLTAPIHEDTTIYVSTSYIISSGFYNYLSKFKAATESVQIGSYNELVAWIDYILFNNMTKSKTVKATLTYKSFSTSTDLVNEVLAAVDDSTFPYKAIGYSYYHSNTKDINIYISKDTSNEAQKVYDEEMEGTLAQAGYPLYFKSSTRNESFDDFKINNVTKELEVSTTNQLVYALEKGLKPICVSGSSAESIYNKAKDVLREICDDSMSNLEKARAIYEWLIFNNSYDHKAADDIVGSDWNEYDSWFAEGVFNNGKAVCDGICKAFLIMAKIEGIPTVRVTGNHHAWNKVYLNGNWFGLDATHGDITVNGSYEALTYLGFLFTDEYKVAKGYTAEEYTDLQATTKYNVYENISFTNGSETFDLFINTEAELRSLLTYVKKNVKSSIYTFEIAVDSASGLTISRISNIISSVLGSSCSRIEKTDSLGNAVYLFIKN